jgi:exodeoxyribonuclease V alpha subunit
VSVLRPGSGAKPANLPAPAPAPWTPLGAVAALGVAPGHAASRAPGEPAWPADVAAAAAAQDLGPELLHLAWEIARLASPARDLERPLVLLALAALAVERTGSTRLPLLPAVLDPLLAELGAGDGDTAGVRQLLERARSGSDPTLCRVFGGPGDYRPLLLARDQLYTERSWQLERRVAARLAALATASSPSPEAAVEAALADVLARPPRSADGAPLALSAEQVAAVRMAFGGSLAVITGGPGTGKTWIVAAILRVVARLGEPGLAQVALAAPTGKAADRIRASVLAALRAVGEPASADLALLAAPPQAATLHRLLSYSPAGERFRHHERNPLGERLVLVDESSMMDLALTDHLLRSLPAGGRLVLLGDARQLPSVDAGAVLRDLVDAPGAAPRVARLRHSFRMDSGDPGGRAILRFAQHVAEGGLEGPGAAAPLLGVRSDPADLTFAGAELLISPPVSIPRFLARWWEARLASRAGWREAVAAVWTASPGGIDPAAAEALGALFAVYESSRLLTATRGWSGGTGAAAANSWCRATLARALGVTAAAAAGADPLPGEPVLVTRNDYRRGLYNGDQGLVLRVSVDGGPAAPMAVFRGGDGFRTLPLAVLRGRLEPAWATTVHKAQGSEHEVVAVVLPTAASRVATRELLYTAITRARHGMVVVGAEGVLWQIAARASERWSGLGEALGGVPQAASAGEPDPKASPRGTQLGLPF